eukprot:m.155479 g.155479  ORF g.155479 m.155479 type:complete len:358 (+) comp16965_c0_seq2:189-1262(+)
MKHNFHISTRIYLRLDLLAVAGASPCKFRSIRKSYACASSSTSSLLSCCSAVALLASCCCCWVLLLVSRVSSASLSASSSSLPSPAVFAAALLLPAAVALWAAAAAVGARRSSMSRNFAASSSAGGSTCTGMSSSSLAAACAPWLMSPTLVPALCAPSCVLGPAPSIRDSVDAARASVEEASGASADAAVDDDEASAAPESLGLAQKMLSELSSTSKAPAFEGLPPRNDSACEPAGAGSHRTGRGVCGLNTNTCDVEASEGRASPSLSSPPAAPVDADVAAGVAGVAAAPAFLPFLPVPSLDAAETSIAVDVDADSCALAVLVWTSTATASERGSLQSCLTRMRTAQDTVHERRFQQ